jgi:hypothetical protein
VGPWGIINSYQTQRFVYMPCKQNDGLAQDFYKHCCRFSLEYNNIRYVCMYIVYLYICNIIYIYICNNIIYIYTHTYSYIITIYYTCNVLVPAFALYPSPATGPQSLDKRILKRAIMQSLNSKVAALPDVWWANG